MEDSKDGMRMTTLLLLYAALGRRVRMKVYKANGDIYQVEGKIFCTVSLGQQLTEIHLQLANDEKHIIGCAEVNDISISVLEN